MTFKKLIAIDYSLNGSAFILGDTNGQILDYIYFSPEDEDQSNKHCIRTNLNEWASTRLDKVMKIYWDNLVDIDTLVLEGEAYGARGTTTFKDGYAIIKYLARRRGVWYLEIPPTSSKLFFADDARAKKGDMIKVAKKEFKEIEWDKISPKHQEDIADALSLFRLGVDYYNSSKPTSTDTSSTNYFLNLPLNRQMVISLLKNWDDLHTKAKKEREKIKRASKTASKTSTTKGSKKSTSKKVVKSSSKKSVTKKSK